LKSNEKHAVSCNVNHLPGVFNMKQSRFQETKTEARKVYTRANTSFKVWREMVLEEFKTLGVDPSSVSELRMLHAWEGKDTTLGWAQHVAHNNKLRARTALMKKMNPEHYKGYSNA
jgi:hypothetical protein